MKKLLLFGAIAFGLNAIGQENVSNNLSGSTYVGTFFKNKLIFNDQETVTYVTEIDQRYKGTYEIKNELVLITVPDFISSTIELKIQDNCFLNKKGDKAYCKEE